VSLEAIEDLEGHGGDGGRVDAPAGDAPFVDGIPASVLAGGALSLRGDEGLLHGLVPGLPVLAAELEEGVGAVVPVVHVDLREGEPLLLLPGERLLHADLDALSDRGVGPVFAAEEPAEDGDGGHAGELFGVGVGIGMALGESRAFVAGGEISALAARGGGAIEPA